MGIRLVRAARRYLRELVRLLRVAGAGETTRVVRYTKVHPIYSDFFDLEGVPGYCFARATPYRSLRGLERMGRRRVALLHRDAASPVESDWTGPQVVECEGRPASKYLTDPSVHQVFVQSQWAARDLLSSGTVALLRPACPIPTVSRRAKREGRPVTLLAVGYGSMVKGFDALDTMWNVVSLARDVRLIVAGAAPHNHSTYSEITLEAVEAANIPAILDRWARDPRVEFGPVARESLLDHLYWRADIYLHLARMETFGYSVLEAMARALPVIGTNINAIPEMVRHGETGFLIDTSSLDMNSSAWREQVGAECAHFVRQLIDDAQLRARMGAAGRARVAHAFSVDHRRAVLARTYEAALADRSATAGPDSQARARAARV
jgi:glycosyltransferase involved in cell wall biosynthesis